MLLSPSGDHASLLFIVLLVGGGRLLLSYANYGYDLSINLTGALRIFITMLNMLLAWKFICYFTVMCCGRR